MEELSQLLSITLGYGRAGDHRRAGVSLGTVNPAVPRAAAKLRIGAGWRDFGTGPPWGMRMQ
jgi:hypothetical protein